MKGKACLVDAEPLRPRTYPSTSYARLAVGAIAGR